MESSHACACHKQPIIGTTLPDMSFDVFHQESVQKLSLATYRQKWLILFFYPADFTFVCPTELSALADLYPEFQKLQTEVLSISTDTVFVHKAWHDQSPSIKKINFPMLADPTGRLCKWFQTYLHDEGVSLRATVIIDPDGMVVSYEVNNNAIGRNVQELLRKLQAAQYVKTHGGEVCPANWKPGSETLKPGLNLVGKI